MFKNRKLLTVSYLLFLTAAMVFVYFLMQNLAFNNSFSIAIPGLSKEQSIQVEINGHAVTKNTVPFYYDEYLNEWHTPGLYFFTHVRINFPIDFKNMVSVVLLKHKGHTISLKLNELEQFYGGTDLLSYKLPAKFQKTLSINEMLVIILHFPAVFFVLLLIFAVSVWYFISYFRFIFYNRFYNIDNIINSLKVKYNSIHKQTKRWFFVVIISVGFAVALFFTYLFIKYTVSCFVTSIIFYLLLWGILYGFLYFFLSLFKIQLPKRIKTNRILRKCIFLLIIVEVILRIGGLNRSYNEDIGFFYASGFNETIPQNTEDPDILLHPPYHKFRYFDNKIFSYEANCNSLGLRDIDRKIEKDSGEYRIIALGNSFTEGLGAPQDSTWPRLLENRLRVNSGVNYSVFNAGMLGSDPYFQYKLLEKILVRYQPDKVLLALASTDFGFYYLRGGFERFTPDGLVLRKAPSWERFYAVSYIVRFVMNNILGYQRFYSPEDYAIASLKAKTDMYACMDKFNQLALKNGFDFKVVFIDFFQYRKDEDYIELLKALKKNNKIDVIDLIYYNNHIEKISFEEKQNYFWWPYDGHCNSKGYDLIAKGIEYELKKDSTIFISISRSLKDFYDDDNQ